MSNRFNSRPSNSSSKEQDQTRAKTPQNTKKISIRITRQSHSLAKSPLNNTALGSSTQKKIQQKTSFIKSLQLHAINQNIQSIRYYYLGKGNNHQMVKKILSRRANWVQTSNKQDFLYLKWTQNSFGFKYHKLGKDCLCFNHFQYHRQISNKQRLVKNLINLCELNKLNAFQYVPLTYIIDLTSGQQDLALHNFLKFYNRNIPANNTQPKVSSLILPRAKFPQFSSSSPSKRPQGNFYCKPILPKTFIADDKQSGSQYLWILKPTFMNRGRGVSLFNSLAQFQKLIWKYYQGEGLQDYCDKDQAELICLQGIEKKQIKINMEEDEIKQQQKNQSKVWSIQNQSSNVQLQKKISNNQKEKSKEKEKNPNEIEALTIPLPKISQSKKQVSQINNNLIVTQQKQNNLRVLSFVVQKYIESPMLINQKKFDIRVWALLTQNHQVYFFKQGYLRFSSHKYTVNNHQNPFIHLTNNSVQKYSAQYNQESGNQIYLSDMKPYMPESSYIKMQAKIREMIWMSFASARRKINVNGRKQCFQIFGFDFMLDSQFKLWLIEINTNPAIDDCSAVLKALIPRMLDDLFKLTIDKLFNNKLNQVKPFTVPNFDDNQNMWELLGDFKQGVNEKVMGKNLSGLRR